MTETIKVEVSDALARRFREREMEIYGHNGRAVKQALERSMQRFVSSGVVDWESLTDVPELPGISSVDLQHALNGSCPDRILATRDSNGTRHRR